MRLIRTYLSIGYLLLACLHPGVFLATLTAQEPAASASPVELRPDAELRLLLPAQGKPQVVTFTHDGTRLLALRVVSGAAGGDARVTATIEGRFGTLRLKKELLWDFIAERAASQLCDQLPQFPTTWRLEIVTKDKREAEIILRLEDQGPAPAVVWNDEPGTLLVRGAGQSRLLLRPEVGVMVRHPLLRTDTIRPDITPNGDAQFRVPAGLWHLEAEGGDGVKSLHSALIPVSGGGHCVVEWPQMRALEGVKPRGMGTLTVRSARAQGELGEVLIAAPMFEQPPSVSTVRLNEGGQPAEVLSIEPVPAELHVVVLFDSSLSMKEIFPEAQQAVLRFVEQLPPQCTIEFFDFDTKLKELKAKDRVELLKAVRKVAPDGTTLLYDSVLAGLKRSGKHKRSAIVVFTDGFDTQHEKEGYGSKAKPEEVFKAVDASEAPLFTIAYGKGPDEATLQKLASLSDGAYFRAQPETIGEVFGRIGKLINRDYRISYRRPPKAAPSNTPVITVVLDVSASMNLHPKSHGCDFRIEKSKDMLRDFFRQMPAGSVAQLFTFSSDISLTQVPTADPQRLLHAISTVKIQSATDTLGAAKAALLAQEKIPSRNRYQLFVTDAALRAADPKAQGELEEIYSKLKEEQIHCLWVGMVEQKEAEAFAHAANLSGGSHIVSPDPQALAKALEKLGKDLAAPQSGEQELAVEVLIDQLDQKGAHVLHNGSGLFQLPLTERSREPAIGCLRHELSSPLGQGAGTTATEQAGNAEAGKKPEKARDDASVPDTVELNRIPINMTGRNSAVEITVHEARICSKLHGIAVSGDRRLVELTVSFTNILPEQSVFIPERGSSHPSSWVTARTKGRTVQAIPAYLMRDLRHHLFLRWNNQGEVPPCSVSLLDAEPLYYFDDPALLVEPRSPRKGRLVFLVEGANLEGASVHLYDTAYQHLDLPLVGKLQPRENPLRTLPTKLKGLMSETFSLNLLEHTDSEGPVAGLTPGTKALFRTIQLSLDSNVQALLNMMPYEACALRIGTDKGPVFSPLAPLTDALPGGLFRPASLAPGSHNRFQQVYCLPKALAGAPSSLFVELKKQDLILPLTGAEVPYLLPSTATQESGLSLSINGVGLAGKEAGLDKPMLAVDITLADEVDNYGTNLGKHFVLVRSNEPGAPFVDPDASTKTRKIQASANRAEKKGLGSFSQDEARKIQPKRVNEKTRDLLFGLPAGASVADGLVRRGVLLFDLPTEGEWVLAFHGKELTRLQTPLNALPALEASWLLCQRPRYALLDPANPRTLVEQQVAALVEQGKVPGAKAEGRRAPTPKVEPDGTPLPAPSPAPELCALGTRRWQELKAGTEEMLWSMVRTLRVHAGSTGKASTSQTAPEAVLTQGGGSLADITELARQWHATRGIATSTTLIELTEEGQRRLRERVPHGELPTKVPLLRTPSGGWLLPLAEDLDKHTGLASADKQVPFQSESQSVTIALSIVCQPRADSAAAQIDKIGGALSGNSGNGTRKFTLWSGAIPTTALSRSTLEVHYHETGGDSGALKVRVEGVDGLTKSKESIDARAWTPVREVIEVRIPGQSVQPYNRELGDAPLAGTHHSLSIGAPDLGVEAAEELVQAWSARPSAPPDHASLAHWLGRTRLARFIHAQTRWERNAREKLGIDTTRTGSLRVLLHTLSPGADGAMRQAFDLRHSAPLALGEPAACNAFRIMQGLADTALEGRPLGGKSVTEFWPTPAEYLPVPAKARSRFAQELAKRKFPQAIVERVKSGAGHLLFSRKPVHSHGAPLWGWLEIDPKTFATRSVLSTGEHGMVEYAIDELVPDGQSLVLGFMKGVEASVWSVCAFSLEESDSEQVLAKAEAFAKAAASNFNSIGAPPSWTPEDGPVSFSLDGLSYDNGEDSSYKSFTDGYNDGVEYYFKKARGK